MSTPKQQSSMAAGIITVYDEEEKFKSLNVPDAGSNTTVTLEMDDLKARQIHMIGLPSAATITLESKDKENNGTPKWWMKLKTTHAPSYLEQEHIDQYVNRNAPGNFIRTALGMLVIGKSTTDATPDTLGTVTISTSAGPRGTRATTPAARGE
nr:hypothetical protein [uncultured Pseudomonas sp.]